MHVIGLIGGIASGKSAVAKELASLGAVVLDADATAHEVLDRPRVQKALVNRWGKEILDADSRIDRSAVAERVFSKTNEGREDLDFLEGQLHPVIRQEFEAEISRLGANLDASSSYRRSIVARSGLEGALRCAAVC